MKAWVNKLERENIKLQKENCKLEEQVKEHGEKIEAQAQDIKAFKEALLELNKQEYSDAHNILMVAKPGYKNMKGKAKRAQCAKLTMKCAKYGIPILRGLPCRENTSCNRAERAKIKVCQETYNIAKGTL